MMTRLKKFWRWWMGREEFNFSQEEQFVLREMLHSMKRSFISKHHNSIDKSNMALWNQMMSSPDRPETLRGNNLSTTMNNVANKLLRQTDYD